MNPRALLSLVLMFTATAVFAHHTDSPHRSDALAMIKRLGGTVEGTPVAKVDLHKSAVTDKDLALLAAFPKLRKLNLSDTRVTDSGLKHLEKLTELRVLLISKTGVTPKGMAHLQKVLPRVAFNEN
jgi:hypothetical protein